MEPFILTDMKCVVSHGGLVSSVSADCKYSIGLESGKSQDALNIASCSRGAVCAFWGSDESIHPRLRIKILGLYRG